MIKCVLQQSQRTLTQLFTTSTSTSIPSSSDSESEIVGRHRRVATRCFTDSPPPVSPLLSVTAYYSGSEASIISHNRVRRTEALISSTTHSNSKAGTSPASSGMDGFAPATCTESTSALHGWSSSSGWHSVDPLNSTCLHSTQSYCGPNPNQCDECKISKRECSY